MSAASRSAAPRWQLFALVIGLMRFTYQTGAQPLAGFTIQRGIHRGGFGEVYYAHSDGGKEVALKLLHPEDHEVEVRGVTQCLNLKHPNLVNLFDVKMDADGDHWVVMEYVAGSSLEDVLASFPDGLPLAEVRDWLGGLVAGVSHLHDRGIVHRDLKPANVYRENGVVKIGDVGLSKRVDSEGRRQHTQSVGTVYYMAPEVARGQYGPEVDVYSLGVMLYELITGKLPFTGETTAEILMKHLTAAPDLSPIPKALRPTVARALEKDPRKRTPSARQLELDFQRACEHAVSETIPESAFVPVVPAVNGHTGTGFADYGQTVNVKTVNGSTDRGTAARVRRPIDRMAMKNRWACMDRSTRSADPSVTDKSRFIRNVIIAVIGVMLFAPGAIMNVNAHTQPTWFGVALILVAIAVVRSQSAKCQSAKSNRKEVADAVPPPVEPKAQAFRMASATEARTTAPPVPLPRSWTDLMTESGHSIGLAGLVASLISAGVYLLQDVFHRSASMPSIEHAVLFASVSILGSWLLLVGQPLTSDPSWTKQHRWYARIATGVILGTCSYALAQFLLVHVPQAAYSIKPVFSSLGMRELTVASVDPTWLGYTWFFGLLFGLRRWSREMDPYRKHRFSVGLTAASVAVAFAASLVFAFPQWYGMLWAGTISTTLQLVSPWTPKHLAARGR